MDFTLSPEIEDLRVRTRAFVEEHVLPLESDPMNFSEHENIPDERLNPVREKAKKAGLWAPQSPKEYGGMDLPMVAWAVMYEEAARSLFGPLAFNCMAPDDGNMNVLRLVGTRAQKDKWLKPIVDGDVRSAFAMTEPAPGGGSDPTMIRTKAERRGNKYVITGRKWFITGADGAKLAIIMAKIDDLGATMFLSDMKAHVVAGCLAPFNLGRAHEMNSTRRSNEKPLGPGKYAFNTSAGKMLSSGLSMCTEPSR
jgi:acyl-CoA dehydrogenase